MIRLRLTHLFHHANLQAFLVAAELATVPPTFVHGAGFFGETHVLRALLHGPLEEALAALAGTHPVVLTRRRVAANGAQLARTRGRSLVAGSASGREGAHGTSGTASAPRLRRLRATTTVDEKKNSLTFGIQQEVPQKASTSFLRIIGDTARNFTDVNLIEM